MSGSTIPGLKAFILAKFEAASTLADVDKLYGVVRDTPLRSIMLSDTLNWSTEWAGIGDDRRRNENFALGLFVAVCDPGNIQREATEAVFEIFDAAEQVVRDNAAPGADLPDVQWIELIPTELREWPGDQGACAVITAELSAHNEI